MNVEDLRQYCLAKNGATENFPFDEVTLVFKVAGKIFLILPLDEPELQFTVKCPPEKAIEMREKFLCVTPGFHMNKSMWNTVTINGSVDSKILKEWIDTSYEEVVKKLTKKDRLKLSA